MKILHTSDWHLGHRLHEQSQFEEQSLFLDWLLACINTNNVDVVLLSGDVFDTGTPSAQSLKMYYNFLIDLRQTTCQHIVITGGNHDAPGILNAPKELLQALSIHVVGKATEEIADEVFRLAINDESVLIAAVPYLRDQDIRKAVAGESFDEISDRYKNALINHYTGAADYCASIKEANEPVFAMGHLFAIGGAVSDSEQSIYVGNLGDIRASEFPELFDYIALGHLHKPQIVGKNANIRYCGSPNVLSFSEIEYVKQVLIVETQKEKIKGVEEIKIPIFRKLIRVKGGLEHCLAELELIDKQQNDLLPWVEVVLDSSSNTSLGFTDIHNVAVNLKLEVLKVSLKKERNTQGIEQILENSKKLKALTPLEVFKMKCNEQEFDLKERPEIFDAFNEVLQIAKDQ